MPGASSAVDPLGPEWLQKSSTDSKALLDKAATARGVLAFDQRTWKNERPSNALLDEVLSVGSAVSIRQITSILIKRQHINFGWDADDKYGHWWSEIGDPRRTDSESYGWWPKHPVTAHGTLMGTEGELNGQTSFGGTLTRDPHHGDEVKHSFHPVVALDDSRNDAEIIDCLLRLYGFRVVHNPLR